MSIHFHQGDLPDDADFGDCVAIDTETLGLVPHRDRLCVVQIVARRRVRRCRSNQPRPGAGEQHRAAPWRPKSHKTFSFRPFRCRGFVQDLRSHGGAHLTCTKIASKLARTYTDRHGLKDLARELLGVELSKQQQSTDWATRRSRRRSFPMRRPTSSICMPCASASTRCSSARTASRSPPPVSILCPRGRVST